MCVQESVGGRDFDCEIFTLLYFAFRLLFLIFKWVCILEERLRAWLLRAESSEQEV